MIDMKVERTFERLDKMFDKLALIITIQPII